MKRQLSNEEKAICIKSLNRIKEEIDYYDYQIQICNLKLKNGLMVEYMKQIRDYKKLKKEFEEEFKIRKDGLNVLNKQLREGVEVIEEKKGKEKKKLKGGDK